MGRLMSLLGCATILLASTLAAAQQSTGKQPVTGIRSPTGLHSATGAQQWGPQVLDTRSMGVNPSGDHSSRDHLYGAPPADDLQAGAPQSNETPQSGISFVVAGDVARPDAYVTQSSGHVMLRDAVQQAGWISESASVLVIRNLEGRGQWSEILTRTGTTPGTEIHSGDVLVVYANSALSGTTFPNCVFVAGQSALVIALDPSGQNRILAGDVLRQLGTALTFGQELQILSGVSGRSRSGVAAETELRHGDILIVREVNRSSNAMMAANQGFAPQVTEWPLDTARSPADAAHRSTEMPGGWPPQAPQATSAAAMAPPSSVFDASAGKQFALPDHSQLNPGALPSSPTFDSGEIFAGSQLRMASLQSLQDEDTFPASRAAPALVPDSDTMAAPLPPSAQTVATNIASKDGVNGNTTDGASTADAEETQTADRVGTGIGNAVFVVGLILAGVLIIGGWLKSESEMRSDRPESRIRDVQKHALHQELTDAIATGAPDTGAIATELAGEHIRRGDHDRTLDQPIGLTNARSIGVSSVHSTGDLMARRNPPQQTWTSLAKPEASVTQRDASVSAPSELNIVSAVATTADPLVRAEEWFSGEWIPTTVGQHTSAGSYDADPRDVSPHDVSRCDVDPGDVSPRDVDPRDLVSPDTASGTGMAIGSDATLDARSELDAPSELDALSGFEQLTELIENRIPTDLCEARLPLKISLFGAPAGPRRLRIDAAHRQLSGPHMAVSAERRKSTYAAAADRAAVASHAEAQQASAVEQDSSTGDDDDDGPVPERAAGSLDRALSFLHGQGQE